MLYLEQMKAAYGIAQPGLFCFQIKYVALSSDGITAEANKYLVPLFTEDSIL